MRVNPFFMPALTLSLMLGTVFGSQTLGLWSTSGRDTSVLSALTPAEVKGWMTLEQISAGIPIPLPDLYALMDIPADIPSNTALKELEAMVPDFAVSTLRTRLAAWLGGVGTDHPAPVAPAEDHSATATTQPPPPTGTIEPTQAPLLATEAPQILETVPVTPNGQGPSGTPGTGDGQLAACTIRGKMTLGEVCEACGVASDALLALLNLPADTPLETGVKDLANMGLITEVRAVQEAVAALQARP